MHVETSTPITVRARRTASIAATALACAALMSACGSSGTSSSSTGSTATKTHLDTARVERSIEQSILTERHLHSKVVCPAVVLQEAGKTFECIATTRSAKRPATVKETPFLVTVQNSKGYVTYVGK